MCRSLRIWVVLYVKPCRHKLGEPTKLGSAGFKPAWDEGCCHLVEFCRSASKGVSIKSTVELPNLVSFPPLCGGAVADPYKYTLSHTCYHAEPVYDRKYEDSPKK